MGFIYFLSSKNLSLTECNICSLSLKYELKFRHNFNTKRNRGRLQIKCEFYLRQKIKHTLVLNVQEEAHDIVSQAELMLNLNSI